MEGDTTTSLPFLNRKQLDFQEGAKFELKATVLSATTKTINIIGLTKSGVFRYKIIPLSDTVPANFVFGIADIPISVSITSEAGADELNTQYCTLRLLANGDEVMVLCQGYANAQLGISYPNNIPLGELERHGDIVTLAVANPGAGNDLVVTLGTYEYAKLKSIAFTYTASGAAANRYIAMKIVIASGQVIYLTDNTAIVASGSRAVTMAQNIRTINDVTTGVVLMQLPTDMLLPPGTVIQTQIINLQGADAITNAIVMYERYLKS